MHTVCRVTNDNLKIEKKVFAMLYKIGLGYQLINRLFLAFFLMAITNGSCLSHYHLTATSTYING